MYRKINKYKSIKSKKYRKLKKYKNKKFINLLQ